MARLGISKGSFYVALFTFVFFRLGILAIAILLVHIDPLPMIPDLLNMLELGNVSRSHVTLAATSFEAINLLTAEGPHMAATALAAAACLGVLSWLLPCMPRPFSLALLLAAVTGAIACVGHGWLGAALVFPAALAFWALLGLERGPPRLRTALVILPGVGELLATPLLLRWVRRWFPRLGGGLCSPQILLLARVVPVTLTMSLLVCCAQALNPAQRCRLSRENQGLTHLSKQLDFYGLAIDHKRGLLLANQTGGSMNVFRLDQEREPPPSRPLSRPMDDLENLQLNPHRDEVYIYDREAHQLLVLDAAHYTPIRASRTLKTRGSGDIAFSEEAGTIALAMEEEKLFILDMESLAVKKEISFHGINHRVIADPRAHAYYFTFYAGNRHMVRAVDDGSAAEEIEVGEGQMDSAFSVARDEVYIAFPLQGVIKVFHRSTLRLKLELPTVLGVRALAVDEERQLLLAGSVCTGHLDTFDLAQPGLPARRQFAGYYLRMIALDTRRRTAYISSMRDGLIKLAY